MASVYLFQQRSESDLEGMAIGGSSVVVDPDSSISNQSPSTNPDDNEGHKEASGKKKKNRCLSCKKKVGLTGNLTRLNLTKSIPNLEANSNCLKNKE